MKNDLEDDLAADPTAKDRALEEAPEEERWDPVGGSQGKRVQPLYNDGEDEDGRPQGVRLVEAGVAAAEFDQMLQADRADPDTDELSDQRIERTTDADIDILERDTDELSDQGVYELADDEDDEDDFDSEETTKLAEDEAADI